MFRQGTFLSLCMGVCIKLIYLLLYPRMTTVGPTNRYLAGSDVPPPSAYQSSNPPIHTLDAAAPVFPQFSHNPLLLKQIQAMQSI